MIKFIGLNGCCFRGFFVIGVEAAGEEAAAAAVQVGSAERWKLR